jgi:predicted acyl esterase
VTLTLHTTAGDAELNTRLWDLTPGGQQSLIARGTYRLNIQPSGTNTVVQYELPANIWPLPPGDSLKLEVTGYDAPHFRPDLVSSITSIASLQLHLPTL